MKKSQEQQIIESIRASEKENRKRFLIESSISRIHQHILEHDTAILSTLRGKYTTEENQERNEELKAYLLTEFYGVTPVDGSFIETLDNPKAEKKVKEDSFFVVNLRDRPGFFIDLFKVGEFYDQDSILCIPKGGKGAYFRGTNKTGRTGYKNIEQVGDFHVKLKGDESDNISRFRKRPFKFETIRTVAGDRMGRCSVAVKCRKLKEYTKSHGMFIKLSTDSDPDAAWPWPRPKAVSTFPIPINTIEEAVSHAEAFREEQGLTPENCGSAQIWQDGKKTGQISYNGKFFRSEL